MPQRPTRRTAAAAGAVPAGAVPWQAVHDRLSPLDRSTLTGAELDELADACFWLDRREESIDARREAYLRHVEAADRAAARRSAWLVFYEHFLVGETAQASGWFERARSHVGEGDAVGAGFLAIAEADRAQAGGDLAAAHARSADALALGRRTGEPDLTAMALQVHGRVLVALGRRAEGMALLDEAMVAVVGGELDPLFTGWIYCAVLEVCRDTADLRRAGEWTDAAMRWCDDLREGRLYPGTCRLHRVELDCLRGAWSDADLQVRRACEELTSFDARYAGDAFYMAGEVRRLVGDLAGAEDAFRRALELGREPQPGLALVWLAQGRAQAAAAALRLALQPGPAAPLPRALLLAARVEAELALGERAQARAAVDELSAVAAAAASPFLAARASACEGAVLTAEDDLDEARSRLAEACAAFHDLALPHDGARSRVDLAIALRASGDDATADLELRAARATFDALGARPDLARVDALLGAGPPPRVPGGLSGRELEVLRLVAGGRTNREVAEALVISEHTVARHVSNIFTKLGVRTRAAATAFAYEHGLVRRPAGQS